MSVLTDFRYAARVLVRSPLFTLTSVLSLAVGIAASTAIFSLADAMLFRPRIGIADPATVVDIGRSVNGEGFDNFGYPLFTALRDRTTTLQSMAAVRFDPEVMSLGDAQTSERVYAAMVSANYFELLGTRPLLGRFFLPEEDRTAGTHPVAVLTHAFWTRHFAADPSIVGRTMKLNGLPYTVIGVAENGFGGTSLVGADLWVPFAMDQHVRASDTSLLTNTNAVWHTAIGRLKPGVTPRQAQEELHAIAVRYLKDLGDDRASRWGIAVVVSARVPAPIHGPVIGFIAVLGTLTGLVLLIACSNVAGMLLARALGRRREVATRLAVGASRGRIITQLLVEGLVLSILAAALSLPATTALVGTLNAFQPDIPIPLLIDLRVDPRVMAFATALSMLTAIVFALLPALQATRFEVAPALHGTTATTDRRRAWLRQGLVAGQVAMALLLLVAAGLFLRSLQEAAAVDAGFNTENVDVLQLDVRLAGYRRAEGARAIETLIERFAAGPGVTAVGAGRMMPLQGGGLGLGGLRAPGYVGPNGRDFVDADWDVVSSDYFRTLEIPIVRGRGFTAADTEGAPFVAIVNETLAERVWPGRDPIGQQLIQQAGPEEQGRPLQIVGVARNAKYRSLAEASRNFIYVPHLQQNMAQMHFFVRRPAGQSTIADLRKAVVAFDPSLPVIHTQTFAEATAISLLPQRIAAWIAASVGSIGLLLAALGLYGVTAFSVAQRTREIAVRMALGATRESVLSLILRQSARLAVIGGGVGFALALGVSMLLQSLLIGIEPVDPLAFAAAVLLMTLVLLAASWSPARRASRMDPMQALRAE